MRVSGGKGRNEGRPIQGIDTHFEKIKSHLTNARRNEGRPIQGIDTFHFFSGQPASVCRNEGRPIQGITTPALTHMLS